MTRTSDLTTQPPAGQGPTAQQADDKKYSRRKRTAARRHRLMVVAMQIGVAVVLVGAWQLTTQFGLISPFFVGMPSQIVVRIGEWLSQTTAAFGQTSLYRDLGITLLESVLGLLIGGITGFFFGFLLARFRLAAEIADPYIKIGNAMPRVILAPVFLLIFGLGIWSKVALGVSLVFFLVFFNTYQGVRDVDQTLVQNSRMLGASERDLLRRVYLPSALTWIFASLHISVGMAIVGAVVGEYVGSSKGMGYRIAAAQGTFDTTGVFAGLVILAVVVFFVDYGVTKIENYLLRWKPPQEADARSY